MTTGVAIRREKEVKGRGPPGGELDRGEGAAGCSRVSLFRGEGAAGDGWVYRGKGS